MYGVRTYLTQGRESESSTGGVAECHQSHGLQGRHLSYIHTYIRYKSLFRYIDCITQYTYMNVVALLGGSESSLDHGVAQGEGPIERPPTNR